ncbi:hypothetical protein WN943_003426 [Citrus x changshan-huyou]
MDFGNADPPPLKDDRSTKKARFWSQGADRDNPITLSLRGKLMESQRMVVEDLITSDGDLDFKPEDIMWWLNCLGDLLAIAPFATDWECYGIQPQLWTLHFDSLKGEYDSVIAWIQLPGKFARIAIEVTLSKPLVSQFLLDGKGYEERDSGEKGLGGKKTSIKVVLETGAGRDILNILKFGLWMVVSRKRNPRVNKGKELVRDLDRDHRSNFGSSSHFVVLLNDTDEDFDKETKCEELNSPPPIEDDRLTKKTKFRAQGEDIDNPSMLSFRDKLMKQQRGVIDAEVGREEFMGRENDIEIEKEDVVIDREGFLPSISFSQKVHEQLIKPWQSTVVVKFLGRMIGYKALCSLLEILWPNIGGYSIIDLDNGYFLVKFRKEGDADFVFT